ncbi:MAG TPA: cation diffusion facilitator family transporter [Dehalococcoidia bacterium]|nr:cation diffusion facilitator family transporter [Dehalococcoidia bacterium]
MSAATNQRPLALVLGLTAAYVIAELTGGILTHSLALIADAGHTLTDVLGLGMALAAIWFARRPASAARTYGFYRTEMLAALFNSILPFGIAAFILYEAWQRLHAPPEVNGVPMLLVASVGVVINLIGVRLLHAGADQSLNVHGAFLEVLADLVGAVAVIVAGIVILLTGWRIADPIVSIGIALFILPRAWRLLSSVVDVLLEAAPSGINLGELEPAMRAIAGVIALHELHVWTITSGFVAMSGHVEADGRPSSDVLHDLQALLRTRFGIEHATLQVERPGHAGDGVCCAVDPRCLVIDPTSVLAQDRTAHSTG